MNPDDDGGDGEREWTHPGIDVGFRAVCLSCGHASKRSWRCDGCGRDLAESGARTIRVDVSEETAVESGSDGGEGGVSA